MSILYEQIGGNYAMQRRPEPRIFARIQFHLRGMSSLLNVGAGTGSYEPIDIPVIAVEPSMRMIFQRRNLSNVIQAGAEALPLRDRSFDAVMAVLTIHHWKDKKKGLEECVRVSRNRLVILTWDPTSDGFWLVREYFPELLAFDRTIFPTIEEIENTLGHLSVERLPIPADCIDGFLGAYWRRPNAYLDKAIRSGMSSFSRIVEAQARLEELQKDIASGRWERQHQQLLVADELDIGYRIIIAEVQ